MAKEAGITISRETFKGDGLEVSAVVAHPLERWQYGRDMEGKGTEAKADVARPAGVEKAPAVIIVHEWWGLNKHIEDIAQRFAREGFIAVAADLYHGKTTKDAQEASKLMGALKQEDGLSRLRVVLNQLRATPDVSAVGVTGFCMGGTFALLLACNAQVDAAAPFYGDVPADAGVIGKLSCPVYFIGAEKDQWITVEKMNRLDAALKRYGKEGEVKVYRGADHAFFNDTRPEVYSRADAEDAWKRVIEFFDRNLRKGQAVSA
jgi:carboxymethylenebutenolidase